MAQENYSRTYTTFSGCDIVATFNGKVIGELQAITYSISREKAPVYTMGSTEPRSFSRGKRGIAGTIVFTVFNRDALIEEFKTEIASNASAQIQKFKANIDSNSTSGNSAYMSIDQWDTAMSGYASNGNSNAAAQQLGKVSDLVQKTQPRYADEILPFDITITFANEYGQRAVLVIYGVELLNEGAGFSIDSVVTEKAYTFVARRIDHMKAVDDENDQIISATW
jgi:hypothetical protein